MARNNNIDFLKVLLSLLVIGAHVFPTIEFNNQKSVLFFQIQGLARLTVPLFLIISGFYLKNKQFEFFEIKKIAKKLMVVFLVWQIIYFKIEYEFYKLNIFPTKQVFIDMIFGIAQLWYLVATSKALFLVYFVRNWRVLNKIILSISLLVIGYVYQYVFELQLLNETNLLNLIYPYIGTNRNFLFYAFPYLLLGTCYDFWRSYAIKYRLMVFIFFIGLFIESYVYMNFKASIFNVFIFPLPISLLLFSIILENKKQLNLKVPSTLSLGMYLIHFYVVLKVFQKFTQLTFFSYFVLYILILIITLILWFFINKLNKKFPIFF
jgi:hypothetical protein